MVFYDDNMSPNCNFFVIFLIHGQFGAIRRPDSGRIVSKTYIFIDIVLLSYKTENKTKKSYPTPPQKRTPKSPTQIRVNIITSVDPENY